MERWKLSKPDVISFSGDSDGRLEKITLGKQMYVFGGDVMGCC